jgi:poly(3-hydroxybutyrate) depolymerase
MSLLYTAYELQSTLTAPGQAASSGLARSLRKAPGPLAHSLRRVSAFQDVISSVRLTHERPAYDIHDVLIDGESVPVAELQELSTPFATLLRFTKDASPVATHANPPVLLVTALSGHFSTMLRPTIRALLQDHDVYVTDWHNARDIPLADGSFGFEQYVEHLIRFLHHIGPGAHVLAVCQPCAPALVAASVLAQADDPDQPKTLTLMSGPVDARINPTRMNAMAERRTVDWYRKHCIVEVPHKFAGAGRRVYPGFLQVSAFMSMNVRRHLDSHVSIYRDYVADDIAGAEATKEFYREYYAVLDVTEEFYLDTISSVFLDHELARGVMRYDGRLVEPAALRKTALMTIEAENDDLCAAGQTRAAHDLASGLTSKQRAHLLQPGVGHYGIFAGSRWESEVYPALRDFIRAHN